MCTEVFLFHAILGSTFVKVFKLLPEQLVFRRNCDQLMRSVTGDICNDEWANIKN